MNLGLSSPIRVVLCGWRRYTQSEDGLLIFLNLITCTTCSPLFLKSPGPPLIICEFPAILQDFPYCFHFILEVLLWGSHLHWPLQSDALHRCYPLSLLAMNYISFHLFWTIILLFSFAVAQVLHKRDIEYIYDTQDFSDNIDILPPPLNLFQAGESKST